ncbi:MAG: tetratricopeptide repeat protein, partial [Patescibacteria group bacterium]|nr:tetratricopeptide repeat protein [Patescibacteria group bacterium]
VATPLKFQSSVGNEKLIFDFAQVLYTTAYDKEEKYFDNVYEINSALFLLRSTQTPSLNNLSLQTKCFEYLLKSDSTVLKRDKLLKETFEIYCILGQQYCLEGLLNDAIPAFKKAIELNPRNAEVYNDLGVLYYKKELFDDAIEAYKKSIQLKPNFALVHYNLALVYFKIGRSDECLKYLNESIRLGYNKINPSLLSLLKKQRK